MRGGRDAADLDGDGGAANVAPERERVREEGREEGVEERGYLVVVEEDWQVKREMNYEE